MIYEVILNDTKYLIEVDDTKARMKKEAMAQEDDELLLDIPDIIPYDDDGGTEEICTTMPGQIISVLAEPGKQVQAGETLLILESMKMENSVYAERACTIVEVAVKKGDFIAGGGVLFRVRFE